MNGRNQDYNFVDTEISTFWWSKTVMTDTVYNDLPGQKALLMSSLDAAKYSSPNDKTVIDGAVSL